MHTIIQRIKSLPPEKREELTKRLQEKRAGHRQYRKQVDVAILGGGLAGLTLARQLKRAHADLSILVMDKNQHPAPEAAFKVGESTVELGSYYLREVLDLKQQLEQTQLLKAGLRFYFPAEGNRDITRRVELGGVIMPPIRGHQLDRGRFENLLWDENRQQEIECWDDCNVRAITVDGTAQHTITIRRHEAEETIAARWVIDASGRSSLLKRQLDLSESVAHDASAVWFRIGTRIDVDQWSDDAGWLGRVPSNMRWLGTNHLMGRGYWVWLIPLASGSTSVGIVADPKIHPHHEMNRFERALDWLRRHEPQCADVVEEHQHLLQDFHALKHYAHGCRRVFSRDRWAMSGEAGVFLDPFYSPGTDFISISNCLITDLIMRELRGEAIEMRTELYNHSYLNTFKSFMATYEGQYGLMGNPQVMIAKIAWDWACYWGGTSLLFFNDNKLYDLAWASSMREPLQRFNGLYVEMQNFFRHWATLPPEPQRDHFVNILGFPFLEEFYFGLNAKHDDETLKGQFHKNLTWLEAIANDCKVRGMVPHKAGAHYFNRVGVLV
ncbi:MAG: halogenase [Caldilinea sp. CFX5]|nr:halogenase [Caldilinea sp. CFX5]